MKGKLGGNRNCNENNTKSNNRKINNALVSQIQDIEKHTNVINIWNCFSWVTWSICQSKISLK